MLFRGSITLVILLNFGFLRLAECDQEQADDQDFAPTFYGGRLTNDKLSGMLPQPRRNGKLRSLPNVQIKNFTQKLDHFDPLNQETWMQRYFTNDVYFKPRPNGTIFIIIGGEEATFDEYRLIDGPFVRLAKKYQALVLALEHRFYGESKPTKDTSQKNLAYLNSRQALEDLKFFIESQKRTLKCKNPNARIILYGCSYSGSPAAYFAMMYPDLVAGSIAGFAPLLGVENFGAYFEGVGRAIAAQNSDMGCYRSIFFALHGLNHLIDMRDDEKLSAILTLCEPGKIDYDNPNAIDSIFYEMTATVMRRTQYNRVHLGSKSELGLLCTIMAPESSPCPKQCSEWFGNSSSYKMHCCQLEKFSKYLNATGERCLRHNGKAMKSRSTTWSADLVATGTRQWLWQVCTEFGYFTTTDKAATLAQLKLRIDLNYLQKTCVESFNISNEQVKVNVGKTNLFYGAYLKQGLPKNVFFVISSMDPWYMAFEAAIKSLYGDKYKFEDNWNGALLKNTPHCYEPLGDNSDLKELTSAWEKINKSIGNWCA